MARLLTVLLLAGILSGCGSAWSSYEAKHPPRSIMLDGGLPQRGYGPPLPPLPVE